MTGESLQIENKIGSWTERMRGSFAVNSAINTWRICGPKGCQISSLLKESVLILSG